MGALLENQLNYNMKRRKKNVQDLLEIINIEQKQGELNFNLSALKEAISKEVETYKHIVVTEDTVKESKKDIAMLRKASKEINDRKIQIKKSFMEPYTAFENEVKEALAIIDEPIQMLDAQVKEFETKRKLERKEECKKIYQDEVGEYADYIPFESIFKDSWLNVTASDKDIVDAVQVEKIRVESDLNAIKSLNSEIEDTLLEHYKRTHSLSECITRQNNYVETKRIAEENARREVERREAERKAEEERKAEAERKAEEERRAAEERKAEEERKAAEEVKQVEPTQEPQGFKPSKKAFIVSGSDIEKVEQFLKFSEIHYEVQEVE